MVTKKKAVDQISLTPEKMLGERLREAREKSGLSQQGLSDLTRKLDPEKQGISRTVLTGYEKGKFLPGTRELRVLHDALDLTPNYLVLGERLPHSVVASSRIATDKELTAQIRKRLKELKPRTLEALDVLLASIAPDWNDLSSEASAIDKDIARSEAIKKVRPQ